jgi:hypothetical protein
MAPISGSGRPARAKASGMDTVKPWKPAWTRNRAIDSRITRRMIADHAR